MRKHMRRRLWPEGLDIHGDTPETEVSEFVAFAGLPVPALPFAQRRRAITEAIPRAKSTDIGARPASRNE